MNDFLLKINRLLKSIKVFFKINPHKNWIFVLYTFFTLVSILIIFSLYLLYKIKEEKVFQIEVNQNSTQSMLKESLLKKTTDLQDIKAQKVIDIINNPPVYKDPSL